MSNDPFHKLGAGGEDNDDPFNPSNKGDGGGNNDPFANNPEKKEDTPEIEKPSTTKPSSSADPFHSMGGGNEPASNPFGGGGNVASSSADPFHSMGGGNEPASNPFGGGGNVASSSADPFHSMGGGNEPASNPFGDGGNITTPPVGGNISAPAGGGNPFGGSNMPPAGGQPQNFGNTAGGYGGSNIPPQQPQETAQSRFAAFNQQLSSSQQFMKDVQTQADITQNPGGQQNMMYPQGFGQDMYGRGNMRRNRYGNDEEKSYMQALGEKLFEKEEKTKVAPDFVQERDRKLKHLKDKINKSLKSYRRYERKSKKGALTFRLLSSALAAIVTVFLGINITDSLRSWGLDWWLNTIALIISAFISIIGVIQGFFDADQLYIKYTDTANKLQQLLDMIEYLEQGNRDYITVADVNAIKMEYDRIVESTFSYEMEVRAEDDSTAARIRQQGQRQN